MAAKLLLWGTIATIAAASTTNQWNASLVRDGLKLITKQAEEQTLVPMEIQGQIPAWLNGNYYRNGPGQFTVDDSPGSQHVNALFDGYAITNLFSLDGLTQKATHSSKFIATARYRSLKQRGDMSYQGKIMIGTTPVRKEGLNPMNMGGEMSVNFMSFGNRSAPHLLAVGELPFGMEIDPRTLESINGTDKGTNDAHWFKFDDQLSELGMGCAHPIGLPNGDLLTKAASVEINSFGSRTDYNILRIAAGTSKRTIVASYKRFDLDIAYAHSFAIPSEDYALLPFWALGVSKLGMATHDNLIDGMKYDSTKTTEYVVLNLKTGHATRFEVAGAGFFGFHHTNSWVETDEQGREWIVAHLVTEPDASIFHSLSYEKLQNGSAVDEMCIDGNLQELRVPLWSIKTEATGAQAGFSVVNGVERTEFVAHEKATLTPISDTMVEAPRINDLFYWNKSYSFVYGWHATRKGNHPNTIAKINVEDGSSKLWSEHDNLYGVMMGETVFVPAPGSTAEDDGVLVAAGLHIESERAFVLILNATSMQEIARAYANTHITFGFHSMFIAA